MKSPAGIEKSMTEHEEYVRGAWDDFVSLVRDRFDICDPEGEMNWSAAYTFTVERAEHIRQKNMEVMSVQNTQSITLEAVQWIMDEHPTVTGALVEQVRIHHCISRILSTLDRQLTELCKGLKPEFVEKAKRGEA